MGVVRARQANSQNLGRAAGRRSAQSDSRGVVGSMVVCLPEKSTTFDKEGEDTSTARGVCELLQQTVVRDQGEDEHNGPATRAVLARLN